MTIDDQGKLNPGEMTRERIYNYPTQYSGPTGCNTTTSANSGALSDVPKYTSMTECWAGMDVPPAVTTYSIQSQPLAQTVDTIRPDGSHLTQVMHKGGDFDGLVYNEIISDPSSPLLYQVFSTWEMGDYDSPVVKSVEATNKLDQNTFTLYGYLKDIIGSDSPATNQLAYIKQLVH
jgi:hypothetical protein